MGSRYYLGVERGLEGGGEGWRGEGLLRAEIKSEKQEGRGVVSCHAVA